MDRASLPARRLVAVHAHPDDECITTGGLLSRYAADGHACLVTCTDGQLGEIAELPGIDPVRVAPRLGEVRRAELADACRALGVADVRMLGYHDSGMAGTPSNDAGMAFVNQDLQEVVGRLVAVYREVRPQVLVTYDERGLYGHPDHIHAQRAAMAAIDQAADPDLWPDAGRPWQILKAYYAVVSRTLLLQARRILLDAGHPGVEGIFSEETIRSVGTDDADIAAHLDVTPYLERKVAALRAHRTQWGTTASFVELPDPVTTLFLGNEYFVLARSIVPRAGALERDLFAGIDG